MKEYEERTRIDRDVVSCKCNKCGAEMYNPEHEEIYGLTDLYIEGSYYSPTLEDQTWFKFDLCEQCVLELMDTFKIPPEAGEYYV